MPTISGTVYDDAGAPAAGRIVRAYRRDTGAMLGEAVTSDGLPIAGDTHYANVSLLLHCDGADGSAVFADSSAAPKIFTANGNAKISTAQSKWGSSSLLLDGSGDFLSHASSADFGFGTGDFSLEAWLYPISAQTGIIFDARVDNTAQVWFCYWDQQRLNFYTPSATLTSTITASLNAWHHLSVTRQSGILRLFIDGALSGTATNTTDLGASRPMRIGANPAGQSNIYGHLDDLRITKGVARYTAGFTPPIEPHYGRLPAAATPEGSYGITTAYTGEVQRIVLDDDAGTLYNDLIDRVMLT